MVDYAFLAAIIAIVLLVIGESISGVRVANNAKRAQRLGMADLLPYRRLKGPRKDALALSNGGFLAMFEVRAADAGAFDDESLVAVDAAIGGALGAFSERFVVHLRERQRAAHEYDAPASYYHPLLAWIEARRKRFFMGGGANETVRVLSLAWAPPSTSQSRLSRIATQTKGYVEDDDDVVRADAYTMFERELSAAIGFLKSYCTLRRLAIRRDEVAGIAVERSEIYEELARCIGGRERHISVPRTLIAGNSLLAEPMRGRWDIRVGESEVAIIVLKDFPKETEPLALTRLRQAGLDYDLVIRWMPLSSAEARKLLKGAYTDWLTKANETSRMANPTAYANMRDAENALGMSSDGVRFGRLSPFVVLRAPTRRAVDEAAQKALQILDEIDMPGFITTTTSEDDFFATLPGDRTHGSRVYQMHELTLAHLFSFHEQSSGPRTLGVPSLPKDTGPLAYMVSGMRGEEALHRLTLSTDPPDLLHFLGIGGPGSGKSVSIGMMAVEWLSRIPFGGAITIDKGRSCYGLARFLGAPFFDVLGAAGTESPGFALFAHAHLPEVRREVVDLLTGFIEINNVVVTPQRATALDVAVVSMCEALPPELRSITAYLKFLQDPEGAIKPALALYTRTGFLGRTLDSETDTFDVARFCVVELGALWNAHPRYLIPVLNVLFWKIRSSVFRMRERTGHHNAHWLVQIDEAHAPLKHALGEKSIQTMLKEGRRDKLVIGLWSNAAREFAKSNLLNDFQEAVKTRFYFRNTGAAERAGEVGERPRDFYASLNLPEHGIERLANVASHSMLKHQPEAHELVEVNWKLDAATLAVVGHTSHAENAWLDGVIERYPDTWREEVLRARGVGEDAIAEFLTFVRAFAEQEASQRAVASVGA